MCPPSLLLSITGCQFEIVDAPFESWLQHLHLLWLDERAEQERRRALLRLKIETMQREGQMERPQGGTIKPLSQQSSPSKPVCTPS